jgi:hypothetical protein
MLAPAAQPVGDYADRADVVHPVMAIRRRRTGFEAVHCYVDGAAL